MKKAGKGQSQSQGKKVKRAATEAASLPVNDTPSNSRGDQLSMLLLATLLLLAASSFAGGLIYGVAQFREAFTHSPINYAGCAWALLVTATGILLARALASLAFFGTVALATRFGAWKTVEAIGKKGPVLKRLLPGGTAWLSTAYVQSVCNRGLYKEAIDAAQAEWDRTHKDEKQYQYLGTICFTAGIANQGLNDIKQSHMWNERAIDILNKCVVQLSKPKKGLIEKSMATQSEQALGQLYMQLAGTYFNIATYHFNAQDYRRAKENYRLALENAKKAPDFPQKADMVRFGNDQLARLKHS